MSHDSEFYSFLTSNQNCIVAGNLLKLTFCGSNFSNVALSAVSEWEYDYISVRK